jgi:diguanylate cyclase (GGDEF)-like protein
VTFCNKKFKKFFAINSVQEFEFLYKNSIDIFLPHEKYLHKEILQDAKNFADLINDTQTQNRVVLLKDSYSIQSSFTISVAKITSNIDTSYLVTLTDITKMKEHELSILKKAYHDELTGVYNRTKFNELFEYELSKTVRHGYKLSMAIIDIDHFKKFNDTHGHLIGDEVLILLAHKLLSIIRIYDVFARWGGEEFVILFAETSKEEAELICEKLRVAIAQTPHKIAGNITASFGITEYNKGDTLESMFKRCDEALYMAKENGRNMIKSL